MFILPLASHKEGVMADLEFRELVIPAHSGITIYSGNLKFDMSSGDKLEMKDKDDKFLSRTVPDNKAWEVTVNVHIKET